MTDALGDRMKEYEMAEAGRRLLPLVPVMARIDGRSFSAFTRDFARPYEPWLSQLMVDTTLHLARETGAVCGYTQSDEITLCWYSDNRKSQTFFDGRTQKLCSVLAGMTTAFFMRALWNDSDIPDYSDRLPHFDCRAWSVPTLEEAANVFLWRELDATKNSISMAASCHYSHRELHGKHGGQMQEMLFQKGVNWNDYPPFFKRGTFVVRRKRLRKFTAEELEKLPPKHEARSNPDLMVERSDVSAIEMPPFGKVENRVGVVFFGEEPMIKGAEGAP